MSFWGGKRNNSIMFVKLVCTALIYSRCFFSMNGPQTAIDLNNGESFCIQKKMGTLKNRSFKTCKGPSTYCVTSKGGRGGLPKGD